MIVGVAALPHPPLLVPELVGGAVAETEPVRAACLAAVAELRESTEDWLVVFAGQSTRATSRGRGSFGGFGGPGAEVIVQLDDREPDQTTRPDSDWPLPVLIAAWLRGQVGAHRLRMCPFSPRLSAADSLAAGRELAEAESDDRAVGLLVLGDGCARRSERSPLPPDPRGAAFDDAVARALAEPAPDALAALDAREADELGVSGRVGWQVLAGAVLATPRRWTAQLRYSAAPFGIGYHVASWRSNPEEPRGHRRP
ncbi:class III extradiol ring-cleavage dioxygenase family protein [Actinoalloteichus hymeniacidonis]|uniref:hypothetical protein n=1 Tax=Actinoalloteichus hymeniacidonis TaxID=340345 RepID=UPI000853A81A|nr:hypothetical protein [Actinoalloteichus hymeniacidonis]MBB5909444.1 hypothetical protein [Actinoalloteichus hymeniacidonis]